jgi:glycosyltransferase involved in cell wall biosynthesis
MPNEPELAVILTTYQRPAHLERSLHCFSLQQGVAGRFELIVTDDGSTDTTEQIVRNFSKSVDFNVKWIAHEHRGFRAALCRNNGVRATRARYLLFADGDCLFPRHHIQKHLLARRAGVIRAGDCLRFDREATDRIDRKAIESGSYRHWVARKERYRLIQQRIKNRYYQLVNHSSRPKLIAYDFGIWREDFEAVNGFDEDFIGWGCEDDDLAYRLRRAGRRIISSIGYTHGHHMWHPTESSRPALWKDGANVSRMFAAKRPIQCVSGLVSLSDSSQPSEETKSKRLGAERVASADRAA